MTNVYEGHHVTTTTAAEDRITAAACVVDDGDTSFEIDEPEEDEEADISILDGGDIGDGGTLTRSFANAKIAKAVTTNINDYLQNDDDDDDHQTVGRTYSSHYTGVPHVSIRSGGVGAGDDSGEQTDSSVESHTGSSTPTTADVADCCHTTIAISPTYNHVKVKRLSPLQYGKFAASTNSASVHQHQQQAQLSNSQANSSIAEDNISGSIATTTTEMDLDGIASISPNTERILAVRAVLQTSLMPPPSPKQQQRSMSSVNNSAAAAASAHPAAAFLETDATQHPAPTTTNATGEASNSSQQQQQHKRTMSSSSHRSMGSAHPSLPSVKSSHPFCAWLRWICLNFKNSGIGEPSVYHAMVVIFLEFFAWGLLTMPVISVLNQTFPNQTFLMNGLVMGIKGILSFLSAPLVGALSDIWGRKIFLLITVFFTCAPIPLMTINTWWFFALISISGVFAVTFSVVFAYVADVTTIEERSRAYGLVSATFAASLVISPALGAALMEMYGDALVVGLATAIAVLDVFFILVAVPESLPEKVRPSSWGAPISWEQADPFAALRKVGTDHTILMQCVTVLLSYLPEAGQYSCIFVYLKLKMGFNSMEVAIFIAVVGILSITAQVTLGYLMRTFGAKCTIILGLILEMMQLLWYGFGSQAWMMWAAGILAALGSITYPAISAFVSIHSTPDKQGAVQGMVTGMRGLCNGLGPAMFGVVFYLFNVDLNDEQSSGGNGNVAGGTNGQNQTIAPEHVSLVPGPPFAFGALMVVCAILVAIYIPEAHSEISLIRAPSEKKRASVEAQYEIESGHKSTSPLAPLMRSDSLAQL